jgi:Rod binding domain-containing protein
MMRDLQWSNRSIEPAGSVAQSRLVSAAHEFEAQMMKELLQPLVKGDSSSEADGDAGLGSNGAIGSFAGEALGRGLSSHGGFGIADDVMKSLSENGSISHS